MRDAFELAFSKWSEVSNFTFAFANSGPADIEISFVKDGFNNPTEGGRVLTTTNTYHDGPVPILFNDTYFWKTWTTAEALLDTVKKVAISVWLLKKAAELIFAADLVSVAVHEIGHVLGLGHNSDSRSIMQADMGVMKGSTLFYYMTDHPLPDVDAQSLAGRYSPPPPQPQHEGYAIIGSTFRARDIRSTPPDRHVDAFCWGDREAPGIQCSRGYAYNPFLRDMGYGYWYLHLGLLSDVGDRKYVVGGGILKPTTNISGPGPILEDPPADPNSVAGFKPTTTWGTQHGEVALSARFQTYNDDYQRDADSFLYFILRQGPPLGPPREPLPPMLVGLYTSVGTSSYGGRYQPASRTWGFTGDEGTDYIVAQMRTYADERQNDGAYGQAYAMTYITVK